MTTGAGTIAALIAGGIVGYALRPDGKLEAIDYARLAEAMRQSKPEFIKKVDIDTSEAHDKNAANWEYPIGGSLIYVDNPTTPTKPVYIRMNEPENPKLTLTRFRKIRGPFYRFFIENEAGAGTLNLIITRGFQFELYEGEVQMGGILDKLNTIGDVSVASPGNLYILYFESASQLWKCRSFASWLHASAHQDGGGDEISLAGLAGEPADTVNKTGAQTITGIKTFSSIIILPGTDPTTANQAVRKAYADLFTLLTTFNDHKARHQDGGDDELSIAGLSGEPADVVAKSLFNAYTLLAADIDNTPVAITLAATQLIGRKATGGIVALTAADIRTILGIEAGATADQTGAEIVALLEALGAGSRFSYTKLDDVPSTFTPSAHKTSHQDGGGDEISLAGLAGLLADDQHVLDAEVLAVAAALVHKTRHQDGGADEISVAGLAGEPADTVNKTGAQTIAGVKTFTSIPVLPATDPTSNNQAARKAYVDGKALVSGLIVMWHGSIASIPPGYVICDGNNSTPNLLQKFVQGVATAATDPGATGGEAAHTLTLSELPGPGVGSIVSWVGSGGAYDVSAGQCMILGGGNQAHENKPPFYDVAFIMKT